MISLTMTMRVVRLVAMVGYRRTVKPGNKSMQPTGLHSACLSAWWRQADLSVSTNTHHTTLAFAHRPVLLDWAGVHSHRKVQTCSRNHVFLYIAFTRRASNVRSSHVCVRHERIEHDVPRDRKQSPRSTYLANFFFLDPSKVHQLPSIYTLFRSYRGLFSREIPRNPSSHFNRVLTHLFFLLMNDKYLNSLMMRSLSRGHFFLSYPQSGYTVGEISGNLIIFDRIYNSDCRVRKETEKSIKALQISSYSCFDKYDAIVCNKKKKRKIIFRSAQVYK